MKSSKTNKEKEMFERVVKKTLDNFVENYKIAPSQARAYSTDRICYEFIDSVIPDEKERLKYRDYYDRRKR